MKILYIITGLKIGGAETITVNLASKMQKMGCSVKILYLSGEKALQIPLEIEAINLKMTKTPLGFIRAILHARKIVKNFSPDVVHANMFHAIVFSRILRLLVKIPRLVCTEHSSNFHGKLRRFLAQATDFLSDVDTNVSEQATEKFIENGLFARKKSMTVYNGIDLERFQPGRNLPLRKKYGISENDFVFINVSRITPAKNHKNLLRAFKIAHEKVRSSKLFCIGTGDSIEEIKNYADTLDLKNFVIFTGARTDVEDFYNASDCFVLSSDWEGFGIVLAESMSCGLPVISTDCGGTREVVQNEEWLVPPKNSKMLAEKMLVVMKMTKIERQKISRKNRELTQKFSIDEVSKQWMKIYKNGVEQNEKTSPSS